MNEPEEPIWVRRAIPKTIARTSSRAARKALTDSLGGQTDTFLRRKLIEALSAIDGPPVGPAAETKIRGEIHVEAKRYLVTLGDLYSLDPAAARAVDAFERCESCRLLERLLAERAEDHRYNLFGLLALLYDQRSIWDAFRGLADSSRRPGALEFLDYTLFGDEHRDTLSAISDAPLGDKLSLAERTFGLARGSRSATLVKHLSPRDDYEVDGPFLAVGAIHAVESEAIRDLYPVVEALEATATDSFVLETVAWATERIAAGLREPST